jgi:hypothetical protein
VPDFCLLRQQQLTAADSPGVYAWFVNFGNGTSSWSAQTGDYYARAVRSSAQAKP